MTLDQTIDPRPPLSRVLERIQEPATPAAGSHMRLPFGSQKAVCLEPHHPICHIGIVHLEKLEHHLGTIDSCPHPLKLQKKMNARSAILNSHLEAWKTLSLSASLTLHHAFNRTVLSGALGQGKEVNHKQLLA